MRPPGASDLSLTKSSLFVARLTLIAIRSPNWAFRSVGARLSRVFALCSCAHKTPTFKTNDTTVTIINEHLGLNISSLLRRSPEPIRMSHCELAQRWQNDALSVPVRSWNGETYTAFITARSASTRFESRFRPSANRLAELSVTSVSRVGKRKPARRRCTSPGSFHRKPRCPCPISVGSGRRVLHTRSGPRSICPMTL